MKQIVTAPEHQDFTPLLKSVEEWFALEGKTIYKERNEIKVFEKNGLTINVKAFASPLLFNRFVYRHIRPSKAKRAFENGRRLSAMSIGTPEVIGYRIDSSPFLISKSWLFTLQSPLSRNFYEFGYSDLDGRDEIVAALARFAAQLHIQGILHKDFSPGNILFDVEGDGTIRFELVDINRMKFYDHALGLEESCRNFARLWGRADFLRTLATEYAHARNWNTEEVHKQICHYHAEFWKHRRKHF